MTAAQQPLEITVDGLAALRQAQADYAVLDVREQWEWDICHLADAIHIPLGELSGRVGELPSDRQILVLCHHGQRSMMATRFLRANGFDMASNLAGGIDAVARHLDRDLRTY